MGLNDAATKGALEQASEWRVQMTGRRSASPPQALPSVLFAFIHPAIERIRRHSTPSCLRHVPTLDAFLRDLPLLFRGSIDSRFPAQVDSFLGGPEST